MQCPYGMATRLAYRAWGVERLSMDLRHTLHMRRRGGAAIQTGRAGRPLVLTVRDTGERTRRRRVDAGTARAGAAVGVARARERATRVTTEPEGRPLTAESPHEHDVAGWPVDRHAATGRRAERRLPTRPLGVREGPAGAAGHAEVEGLRRRWRFFRLEFFAWRS